MNPVRPLHTAARASRRGRCPSKKTAKRAQARVNLVAVAAFVAISVSSCASAPTPPVPDGSTRAPVNDPQRVAAYVAAIQQQQHQVQQDQRAEAELTQLRAHVERLRSALKDLLHSPAAEPGASSGARVSTLPLPERSIERQGSALVVRLFYPFGETRVEHTTQAARMQITVYQAARAAQRIEITGYTDSATPDPGNRWVAMQRALNARQSLLDQGVPPDRVVARHHAAGHFLSEGTGPAHRASNRRVELVFHGDMAALIGELASARELSRSLP